MGSNKENQSACERFDIPSKAVYLSLLTKAERKRLREEESELDMEEDERCQRDESHMEKWHFERVLVQ